MGVGERGSAGVSWIECPSVFGRSAGMVVGGSVGVARKNPLFPSESGSCTESLAVGGCIMD